MTSNPWGNMGPSTQRRINADSPYDIFWITDLHGNYGFSLRAIKKGVLPNTKINLKGISVIKSELKENKQELVLILNNKEDWPIFLSLCEDLISVTKKYDNEEKMISAVEIRLKRWQQLLKQDIRSALTAEKQMGLFSELVTLKDLIIPKVDIRSAISSWVGPDFDKQDFLLDNHALEVKSYHSSKKEAAHISSQYQLETSKPYLYLISVALTKSNNGKSVGDIVDDIKALIPEESIDLLNILEFKLLEYGYIPELIKEPLIEFLVDKIKIYNVSEDFPKIKPHDIHPYISFVKYTIDLTLCQEYVTDPPLFSKEGVKSD
ncbi:PD-(D/E)XK motif protein [Mesobacillus subterraneus]|uniref:PD-(D/E)XK motif protein n=1 Tax=Mesobacillus subterraneus TaxID=285983 RepID=UPI00203E38C0|nr:PD-(D/E)XK motif protein [Mesobacillus subterraneus]MCM3572277.1 PD-(D/E)XK motif protein [Mesobacillus subterraneus]